MLLNAPATHAESDIDHRRGDGNRVEAQWGSKPVGWIKGFFHVRHKTPLHLTSVSSLAIACCLLSPPSASSRRLPRKDDERV